MKFTQPVSMEVTKEQFEKDLKQHLIDLGYKEDGVCFLGGRIFIVTNFNCINGSLGVTFKNKSNANRRVVVDNPDLFLALASMNDGDGFTWWKFIGENGRYLTNGNIYKKIDKSIGVDYFLCNFNSSHPCSSDFVKECFTKATALEIIAHFTKAARTTTQPTYPITREDMQRIHDVACATWKETISTLVTELFGVFGMKASLTDEMVKRMFDAATEAQLLVLQKVFPTYNARPVPTEHEALGSLIKLIDAQVILTPSAKQVMEDARAAYTINALAAR